MKTDRKTVKGGKYSYQCSKQLIVLPCMGDRKQDEGYGDAL